MFWFVNTCLFVVRDLSEDRLTGQLHPESWFDSNHLSFESKGKFNGSQVIAVQKLVELLDLPQDLLPYQIMEQFAHGTAYFEVRKI